MTQFTKGARFLSRSDPRLAAIISQVGPCTLECDPDAWRALSCSIIGQQISMSAARAIRGRVAALDSGSTYPSPQFILEQSEETLRSAGLSLNKIHSIRDLASRFVSKEIDPKDFSSMSDEEIVEALIPVRGIGRWTAEMFLIFSLGRPDVFSVGDLGIRKAMARLLRQEKLSPREMEDAADLWRPWRSLASWYLWRSLELPELG